MQGTYSSHDHATSFALTKRKQSEELVIFLSGDTTPARHAFDDERHQNKNVETCGEYLT